MLNISILQLVSTVLEKTCLSGTRLWLSPLTFGARDLLSFGIDLTGLV